MAWPIDLIRSGPFEETTEGLMLRWDPHRSSFLPYVDGNDLSLSIPELKAHRNDIYMILYSIEAKKLQFRLRIAKDKSRAEIDAVDVEFPSDVSVREVLDLLERLGLGNASYGRDRYVVIWLYNRHRHSSPASLTVSRVS